MKKIVLLLVALICLHVVALAAPDSITTGPYKVSFDMGLNQSDYKNITVTAPKTTETLEGIEETYYGMEIVSAKNKTVLSQQHNFSSRLSLFTAGAIRFAVITIKEFKEAQTVATSEDYVEYLKTDGNDPQVVILRIVPRTIDGASGAVASADVIIDPNQIARIECYHIMYNAEFDPGHVRVEIMSYYPWDEGTHQLLNTIHVEKINATT
jgi:hypothetical protein